MTYSEERALFERELGAAIGAWAVVELCLCDLATLCTTDAISTAIAYRSIENFRSRLGMVDSLVQERMHGKKQVLEHWALLQKRLSKESSLRNALAHRSPLADEGGSLGRRYGLVESSLSVNSKAAGRLWGKSAGMPTTAICLRGVAEAQDRFITLAVALQNASCRYLGKPEPFPASDEQAGSPPTIRALRNRMREALSLPPRPSRAKHRSRPLEA